MINSKQVNTLNNFLWYRSLLSVKSLFAMLKLYTFSKSKFEICCTSIYNMAFFISFMNEILNICFPNGFIAYFRRILFFI